MVLSQAGALRAQPPVAPTVVGFIPTRNALAVPRNTDVTAIFDQALNIPSNALRVFSYQAGGAKAGQATVVDRNLIYNPTTDFKAGETVFSTVTSNVRVGPNQPLPKPQVFQFTTATAPSSGTFGGGSNVGGNAVGDVDGDGDLDLLAVNTATNSVRVRLNNGAGSFTDGPEVPVGMRPVDVTLGDVDNDGDLDLLTANNSFNGAFTSGSVSLRLNNGTGTFSGTKEIKVTENFTAKKVLLADLGADATLDILILPTNTSASLGRLVSLNLASQGAGQATGVFPDQAAALQSTIGTLPNSIAIGDMNNDGVVDILTTAGEPNTTVLVGSQSVPVGRSVGNLAVGDVNGDGFLDFIVDNVDAGNNRVVSVRLNTSGTGFAAGQEVPVDGAGGLALGDVDGDGDLDLVANDANGTTARVQLNNGTGTFSGSQQVSVIGTELLLKDVDNNGTLDIVTSGSVRLNQSLAAATPVVTAVVPARNARSAPRNTNVAVSFSETLNNNAATLGALKVFSQQHGGKKAGTATVSGNVLAFNPTTDFKAGETVYTTVTSAAQSTAGAAAKPHVFQFTTATKPSAAQFSSNPEVPLNSPYSLATGDVDGDGDLDLLSATQGSSGTSSTVSVRLNTGTGTFTNGQIVTVASLGRILLGDLDADGDLDLVTSNGVHLNNGSGVFGAAQQPGIGGAALGDVDADGDLDLLADSLVSNPNTSSIVRVRLNRGNGTFTRNQQVFLPSIGTISIVLGDVNNDGILDLLATGTNNGIVTVRLGSGDGSFSTTRPDVVVSTSPYGLNLGDADGDGDLDLFATNTGSTVTVLLNDGQGNFSNPRFVNLGSYSAFAAVGDVDGDGDLDLLAGGFPNSVSLRLNDGSGNFTDGPNLVVGDSPRAIATGDLDGDGTLDFATANLSTASVRLNNQVLAAAPAQLVEQVSLFPNPARSSVRVLLPKELAHQQLQLRLFNTLGQVVLTQNLGPQAAAEVRLPRLPAGVYTVRLTTTQGLINKRLVIQ
ncbi:hypothetical protein GCM10011383_22730 [Hymenobacter cavernae]|uniref:T9SS C-terminal target domain-containing protein n=1 Tax=Hymenobacter cavernae TaxID=2044852 RepID=A0ABQ1U5W7_9BACT|nr:hypothetical protein GCM10011383_22730 [Hymenobacter cavernae]